MGTPRGLTNFVIVAALGIVLLFIWAMLTPPYLGFSLTQTEQGHFVVHSVDPEIESQGLELGNEVIGFTDPREVTTKLTLAHLPQIRFQQEGYVEDGSDSYVANATSLAEVHERLSSDWINIDLANGRSIKVSLDRSRPINSIAWINWFYLLLAILVILPAGVVWSWQPSRPETICLLLVSMGFLLTAIRHVVAPHNIDLYFPSPWLHWFLTESTDVGRFLSFGFGTLFAVYYPNKLTNANLWARILLLSITSYLIYTLLNDWDLSKPLTDQFLHFSFNESTAVVPVALLLLFYFLYRQWQASNQQPVERAQLKWIILAFSLGPVIFLASYQLPILLGQDPFIVRPWLSLVYVFSPFLMMALGVARLDIFNLEGYVGVAYTWAVIGLAFFVTDIALISLVALTPTTATLVSLAVVLWIYLPIRQWLATRLSASALAQGEERFNNAVEKILSGSLSDQPEHPHALWESVLQQTFAPAKLEISQELGPTRILNRGQGLFVASTGFSNALLLEFASNGSRLFDSRDVELLRTLATIYEQVLSHRDAFESGQYAERERIRRDLHDQIGANLVSLVYTAREDNSRRLASETLEQLRELVRALKTEPVSSDTLAADIRQLCQTSCSNLNLELQWNTRINTQREVGPTDYLNLMNITRELLSNTIKHAQAKSISLSLDITDEETQFVYADDGLGLSANEAQTGNGLRNIEARAKELGGHSEWTYQNGFSYSLKLTHSGL